MRFRVWTRTRSDASEQRQSSCTAFEKISEGDKSTGVRRLVIAMLVHECTNRIMEKGYDSAFLGRKARTKEEKAIDGEVAKAFMGDYLLEPSNELAKRIAHGQTPEEVQEAVQELVLGFKSFGRTLLFNALVDAFGGQPLGIEVEGAINEIGRRGDALRRITDSSSNPDQYMTALVMMWVAYTYHVIQSDMRTPGKGKGTFRFSESTYSDAAPKLTPTEN